MIVLLIDLDLFSVSSQYKQMQSLGPININLTEAIITVEPLLTATPEERPTAI